MSNLLDLHIVSSMINEEDLHILTTFPWDIAQYTTLLYHNIGKTSKKSGHKTIWKILTKFWPKNHNSKNRGLVRGAFQKN